MTDEELKELVAANSRAIAEDRRTWAETRDVIAEHSREIAENNRAIATNNREIAEHRRENTENNREIAEHRREIAENNRAIRELREESERRWQETREEILVSRRETDRLITGLNRRLGEIGNSLGLYTESMFQPSLKRILRQRFGMTVITAPQKFQIDGVDYEVDVVGHSGDQSDEVYLAEIKSQLREDGIHQILEHLQRFPRAFLEHRGKKLFGILAAVTIPASLRSQALKAGLYLATVKDDVFELSTPDDFVPRPFGLRSAGPGPTP